ncbi:MAG: homoserine kinase [Cyclobacteriaceae bacterium]|nr:homoserine kinase [Cyclobacteriaceae bacterium]UYN86319.1 MAG: homoserine kinase [Cyclobacteriaceae bacterium]
MMNTNWIKAFAPATVANVSCGFDVFGFALHQPGDEVEVRLNDSGKILIAEITGDNNLLPREAHLNTCGVAVQQFLQTTNHSYGAEIKLNKKLPLGSGLGSSAASAVAALVAINYATGNKLTRKELLPFAIEAERIACGSAHADNVAPCLFGGFVLIRDKETLDIINIPTPSELVAVVVHPHIEIKTSDARQAMRKTLSLNDAVKQWGNTAALVAGLMKEDYDLIGRSLEDVVAEPVRSIFIPGYYKVKQAALQSGALGCGISGSGPSVFAWCKGEVNTHVVASAMQETFQHINLKSDKYISGINSVGAQVLSSM